MKAKAELVREVIELQRQVNRALEQYPTDAWMELNLTVAQLKSLFFIAREGGTSSSKLAAALGVTPSNVTGIVDRLVEQGLVSRRENHEDRRRLLLQATSGGEAILADLRERRVSQMADVLGRLALEDLATLARGLASLLRAAEAGEGKVGDGHGGNASR